MIRNLRILTLTLAATLTMSAAMTSMAQATTQFTSEKYPTTLTGDQDGKVHTLVAAGLEVECPNATFHGTLTAASTSATITPSYGEECKDSKFALDAEVFANGCDFLFTALEFKATDEYDGKVHLMCPVGKKLEIIFPEAENCSLTIAAQGGLTKVTYTDKTAALPKKDITIDLSLSGLKYEPHDGFLCPIPALDNTVLKTDGTYTGNMTLTGENPNNANEKYGIDVG